jgi:hypothetical protein
MRAASLLFLFILFSCAEAPLRVPASIDTEFYFDDISKDQSVVRLFPPENQDGVFHYYFFLQLKNSVGRYTDIDERDVELKQGKSEKISFTLERQLRGRYYLKVDTREKFSQKQLDVYVQGKLMKEQFKLSMAPVDMKMTKLKLLSKRKHRAKFQLILSDKEGKGVEIPTIPEIILDPEGYAEIEDLVHVKQGVWEFTMTYPEHNIILYLSVRAHGVYLEKLFRFQHVEKSQ